MQKHKASISLIQKQNKKIAFCCVDLFFHVKAKLNQQKHTILYLI